MCVSCAALQVPAHARAAAPPRPGPPAPATAVGDGETARGAGLRQHQTPWPGVTRQAGRWFLHRIPMPAPSTLLWVPGKAAADLGPAACEEQGWGCTRPAAAAAACVLTPSFHSLPSAGSGAGTAPAHSPAPGSHAAYAPQLFLPTHISRGSHTHPRLGSLLELPDNTRRAPPPTASSGRAHAQSGSALARTPAATQALLIHAQMLPDQLLRAGHSENTTRPAAAGLALPAQLWAAWWGGVRCRHTGSAPLCSAAPGSWWPQGRGLAQNEGRGRGSLQPAAQEGKARCWSWCRAWGAWSARQGTAGCPTGPRGSLPVPWAQLCHPAALLSAAPQPHKAGCPCASSGPAARTS